MNDDYINFGNPAYADERDLDEIQDEKDNAMELRREAERDEKY